VQKHLKISTNSTSVYLDITTASDPDHLNWSNTVKKWQSPKLLLNYPIVFEMKLPCLSLITYRQSTTFFTYKTIN